MGILIIFAVLYILPTPENSITNENWVGYNTPVIKYIGGQFNASLYLLARLGEYESGDILYTREGVEHRGYYVSAFESVLKYIKVYTPSDSTIFAWWDYGNMIIGYGEREVIATNPSKRLLIGVTNATTPFETDPEENIEDIGRALTATDPYDTITIMKKYDSDYLLIPRGLFGDEGKAKWIFYAAGISLDEMDNYWINGEIVGIGKDTILYKMLNQMEVENFKMVYSDAEAALYQVVP